MQVSGTSGIGPVMVQTTQNRGFSVDEIVERALDKIISVSADAPDPIRQQAEAFKDRLRIVLRFYMQEAVRSDRTTVYNILKNHGHADIAGLILKEAACPPG